MNSEEMLGKAASKSKKMAIGKACLSAVSFMAKSKSNTFPIMERHQQSRIVRGKMFFNSKAVGRSNDAVVGVHNGTRSSGFGQADVAMM